MMHGQPNIKIRALILPYTCMTSAGTSRYSDVSALFIMPTVSLCACAMIVTD
jgi:hypothetical protein